MKREECIVGTKIAISTMTSQFLSINSRGHRPHRTGEIASKPYQLDSRNKTQWYVQIKWDDSGQLEEKAIARLKLLEAKT